MPEPRQNDSQTKGMHGSGWGAEGRQALFTHEGDSHMGAWEADLTAMLRLSDARRAELAAARARCVADAGLVAVLTEQAARRGEPGIDWPDYFRNARLV